MHSRRGIRQHFHLALSTYPAQGFLAFSPRPQMGSRGCVPAVSSSSLLPPVAVWRTHPGHSPHDTPPGAGPGQLPLMPAPLPPVLCQSLQLQRAPCCRGPTSEGGTTPSLPCLSPWAALAMWAGGLLALTPDLALQAGHAVCAAGQGGLQHCQLVVICRQQRVQVTPVLQPRWQWGAGLGEDLGWPTMGSITRASSTSTTPMPSKLPLLLSPSLARPSPALMLPAS